MKSEFHCPHKENWAPGQRRCLRCHAKDQTAFRRRKRLHQEVSHDLLSESQRLICRSHCFASSHHDLCRMISCFLRVSKPGVARRNRNKPDEAETMRKLSIWYKEHEL